MYLPGAAHDPSGVRGVFAKVAVNRIREAAHGRPLVMHVPHETMQARAGEQRPVRDAASSRECCGPRRAAPTGSSLEYRRTTPPCASRISIDTDLRGATSGSSAGSRRRADSDRPVRRAAAACRCSCSSGSATPPAAQTDATSARDGRRRDLPQRRDVVEDVERSAVRADHQVVVLDHQIADRGRPACCCAATASDRHRRTTRRRPARSPQTTGRGASDPRAPR